VRRQDEDLRVVVPLKAMDLEVLSGHEDAANQVSVRYFRQHRQALHEAVAGEELTEAHRALGPVRFIDVGVVETREANNIWDRHEEMRPHKRHWTNTFLLK
jgi:hypothetical protein